MKKAFLKSLALAVVGSVCVAGSAMAAPITGGIGMTGAFTPVDSSWNEATIPDSTGIDFGGTFLVTSVTGDFDSFIPFVSTGTINDFQFASPVFPVKPLWTLGDYTFEMTSLSFGKRENSGTHSIDITGLGTLRGAGYDDTPGIWNFTGNGVYDANFSWSASTGASPVPEPATMLLFGTGLIGLAGVRRKMSK